MNQPTNQQPWPSLLVMSCFFAVFKCVIKFMGGWGWNAPTLGLYPTLPWPWLGSIKWLQSSMAARYPKENQLSHQYFQHVKRLPFFCGRVHNENLDVKNIFTGSHTEHRWRYTLAMQCMLLNVRNQNVVFKRFSAYSEEVRLEVKILQMLSFSMSFSIECNLNIAECKLQMYY